MTEKREVDPKCPLASREFNVFPHLTLAGPIVFLHTPRPRGGGATPLAVWPLIKLELRGKNERVGRYEMQRLIHKFKVSGNR